MQSAIVVNEHEHTSAPEPLCPCTNGSGGGQQLNHEDLLLAGDPRLNQLSGHYCSAVLHPVTIDEQCPDALIVLLLDAVC